MSHEAFERTEQEVMLMGKLTAALYRGLVNEKVPEMQAAYIACEWMKFQMFLNVQSRPGK